jgi:hypothetical protein
LWPTILGELTAAATIPNASIAPTLVQRGRKCVCLSPCSPYASLRAPDRFTDAATRCLRLGCPPPNSRHGAKTPCASLWAQRPRPLPAVRAAVGFLLASLLVPSILGHAAWQLCRRLSRRHRARGAVVVTPHPPHGRHPPVRRHLKPPPRLHRPLHRLRRGSHRPTTSPSRRPSSAAQELFLAGGAQRA